MNYVLYFYYFNLYFTYKPNCSKGKYFINVTYKNRIHIIKIQNADFKYPATVKEDKEQTLNLTLNFCKYKSINCCHADLLK
jgi:hypothetical protein